MLPKFDSNRWTQTAFYAIMQACTNPSFIEFVQVNKDKEMSDKFHFSIWDNTYDHIFYIYRYNNEWYFWHYPERESFQFLMRKEAPVVFI